MKRLLLLSPVSVFVVSGMQAQSADGPTDPKAQKRYAEGMEWLKQHDHSAAIGSFKKADKQDGGHCVACQKQIIKLGLETGDFKAADEAAQEGIAAAKDPRSAALAH